MNVPWRMTFFYVLDFQQNRTMSGSPLFARLDSASINHIPEIGHAYTCMHIRMDKPALSTMGE